MKTTRVGGGHPDYGVLADAAGRWRRARTLLPAGSVALHRRQDGRCLRSRRHQGRSTVRSAISADGAACEAQFRNAFLMGCVGAWSLASQPDRHRQAGVQPRSGRGDLRQEDHRRHARRHRRGDDRRQDAGRRHLEAGQGDRRSGPTGRRKDPVLAEAYGLASAGPDRRRQRSPTMRGLFRASEAVAQASHVAWKFGGPGA